MRFFLRPSSLARAAVPLAAIGAGILAIWLSPLDQPSPDVEVPPVALSQATGDGDATAPEKIAPAEQRSVELPASTPESGRSRPVLDFLRDTLSETGVAESRRTLLARPREEERTVRSPLAEGEERATKRDSLAVSSVRRKMAETPERVRYPEKEAVLETAYDVTLLLAVSVAATTGLGIFASTRSRYRWTSRRKDERVRVSHPGLITAPELPEPVPCTILDLSLGGGRIGLDEVIALPPFFDLVFVDRSITRAVEVRWHKETEFGVRFLS